VPYKLRSLSGLLAFDAAARHESLTLAAQELGRTQSAVSQQVKQLEEQTGLALFVRRPRKVLLTPDGRALAEAVRSAFEEIETCVWQRKNTSDKNIIRITMVHSFAWKWLSPRLPRFNKLHPEYDVRFDASDTAHDLEADGYDLGIRYGQGSLEKDRANGYDTTLLWKEHYVVVYSPELTPKGTITTADFADFPLLHWSDFNMWDTWLKENGIEIERPQYGKTYSHAALMVQGTMAGAGVAIAPVAIAHDAIMAGDLLVVSGKPINNSFLIRALLPLKEEVPEKIEAFRSWLQEEFSLMQAEAKNYLE
tara:strand:- start:807 stop:1730 length:924 start_codon:yes stop_codon:yes gene_type:complete